MVSGFNQIVEFFGNVPKVVAKQFKVNPNLQRTQVSGNLEGETISTKAATNIVQEGIIRLKNRAVPLNSNQTPKKRSPRQIITPADAETIRKQKNRRRA